MILKSNIKQFTKKEYRKAIKTLELAITQLAPDGNHCVVCEDGGHQAWECHHNPLVMSHQFWILKDHWRCFHCNVVFTDEESAKAHFGEEDYEAAVCLKEK